MSQARDIDDDELRAAARILIQDGKLPKTLPNSTLGGPGEGACCALCGLAVMGDEQEMEIELVSHGHDPGAGNHHFHVRCFAAWQEACRDLAPAERGLPVASAGYSLPETIDRDTVHGHGSREIPGRGQL